MAGIVEFEKGLHNNQFETDKAVVRNLLTGVAFVGAAWYSADLLKLASVQPPTFTQEVHSVARVVVESLGQYAAIWGSAIGAGFTARRLSSLILK